MEDDPLEHLPYHALLCEILSSALGVTCCARIIVNSLLATNLSGAALDRLLDDLGL
jgi:hypothetical protein